VGGDGGDGGDAAGARLVVVKLVEPVVLHGTGWYAGDWPLLVLARVGTDWVALSRIVGQVKMKRC
jgi:hypothetical protein